VNAVHDQEQVSALIGDIYDAALDRSLWVDILGKAALFVGGAAAALFAKSAARETVSSAYDYGIDPHWGQLYRRQYVKIDPLTTGQFFADIEEPIATADVILYDEFLETRFYREWMYPQGLVDSWARCSKNRSPAPRFSACSATSATEWSTMRRAGAFGSSRRTFAAPC
jgi:hypothetical protein